MDPKTTDSDVQNKEDDFGPDIIPDTIDDNTDPVIEAGSEPAPVQQDDLEDASKESEKPVDPRVALGRSRREDRMKQMDGEFEQGSDPKIHGGQWSNAEQQAQEDGDDNAALEPVAKDNQPGDNEDDQETIEVVVHGKKVQLTRDQLIDHASKDLATVDQLDVVKALKNELLDLRKKALESQQGNGAETQQPEDTSKSEQSQLDNEAILDLIDTIQTGDREEAAKALDKFLSSKQPQKEDQPYDLDAALDAKLSERDLQREQKRQVDAWADKNKDITADDDLSLLLAEKTSQKVIGELVEIGFVANELQDWASANGGLRALSGLHREYRNRPEYRSQLSEAGTILDGVASEIRQRFKMPEPGNPAPNSEPQVPNRQQRKKELSQQPRSGAVKQAAPNAGAPQRKSPSDIVKKMAKSRGQVVG